MDTPVAADAAPAVAPSSAAAKLTALVSDAVPFLLVLDLKEEGLRGLTLLHGTSLVYWLLNHPTLNCCDYAPMPLLLFLLEKLMRDLRRRECFAVPVFFEAEREVLPPYHASVWWLVRRHLQLLASSNIAIDLRPQVFPSAHSAEWREFQRDSSPSVAFALMPDDDKPHTLSVLTSQFLATCLVTHCSIAPLDDIEFQSSSILGPLLKDLALPGELVEQLTGDYAALLAARTVPPPPAPESHASAQSIVLAALHAVCGAPPADAVRDLQARVAVVALVLQTQASAAQRALSLIEATSLPAHSLFLTNLFQEIARRLPVCTDLPDSVIFDLIDVNLFRHVLRLAARACVESTANATLSCAALLRLSPALVETCATLWRRVAPTGDWASALSGPARAWLHTAAAALPSHASAAPPKAAVPTAPPKFCAACQTPAKPAVAEAPKEALDTWEDIDTVETALSVAPVAPAADAAQLVLFPLHSPVFARVLPHHAALPHLAEDDATVAAVASKEHVFDELYHWHSLRPLAQPAWKTRKSRYMEEKKLKLAVRLQKYSESLVGIRLPRTIVTAAPAATAKSKNRAATEIQRKNMERLLREEAEAKAAAVADDLAALSAPGCTDWLTRAKNLLRFISDNRVAKLQSLRDLLAAVDAKTASAASEGQQKALRFRIELEIQKLDPTAKFGGQTPMDFTAQLTHCGDMMQWREPAVSAESGNADVLNYGFVPEAWQRRMITAIDERKSVLVCAPTSSGKTFIAFYVIESLLKEDEGAVVVFVVPTKALVNQVCDCTVSIW